MFSRAAGSFVDRLKNLSRRDMAFVAIGLSVLVMAPVAEYMISQPSQDNVLKGNDFAQRHGDAGPFEPGINGLSQGSADGSGEVITPLTSRDPASLILGSQPAQPVLPPAVTAPPSSSWRDAVTDSGRAAFSAVSKSVGAPTVIPRMAASLRGFTSFGGDGSSRTSGSLAGGKIIDDAKSASSKAAKRSMIGPVAMAGYKGVATGNPNSASKGAFEKLRGAADKSASNFSGGSAMNSLDKAAADAVQIGAGTGGAGGLGEGDKTKSANNYDNKYKHDRSGESLAEMAAKERQKKALEWEFFKKYEIKKTIVNAVVNAFATTLGKFLTGKMEDAMGLTPGSAPKCYTTVRDNPDWAAAEAAVAAGTVKSTLEYVCKADGGPIVVSYQMGKESATSMTKKCICDAFAKSAPSDPAAAPGAANPIVPGATPDQISANTAENISDYDSVLKTVVLPAVKGYHKVAKKSVDENMQAKAVNKEEEEAVTLALNDAMTKLNTAAASSVTNAINAKNAAARKELNAYGRAVNTASSLVASSKAKQNIDQLERLRAAAEADAKAGKCSVQLNKTTAQAGSEAAAAKANCEAIVASIDKNESYEAGKGSFKLANEALKSHTLRNSVLSRHMSVMEGAVSAMMTRHASVPVKVKAILDVAEGKTMLAKIEEIIAKDADIPADPAPAAAKSTEEKKPLLIAIEDLRGITLASFWEEEFNSKKTVEAEQLAWEPFDKAAGTESPGTLGAPSNFEAAIQRPNEMVTSVAGAKKGLSDIATLLDTAETNTQAAVDELKKLAAPCNFTEAGCTPAAAEVKPDEKPADKPDTKPDQPQLNSSGMTQEQAASASANLGIIDDCYDKTNGFTSGAQDCDVDVANRLRSTLSGLDANLSAERRVRIYARDAGTACAWVKKCRGASAVPASCSGR